MKQSVGYVAVVVRDYDEAIKFYVDTLGFDLVEDTYIKAQDKRWVLVAPPGSTETKVLLARAVGSAHRRALAIRQEAAFSCFCTPMISGEISMRTKARESSLFAGLQRRAMASWRCSEIFTAIFGTCCNSRPEYPPRDQEDPNPSNGRQAKTVRSACYAVGLHRLRRKP